MIFSNSAGTSGFSRIAGIGLESKIALETRAAVSPRKGNRPVAISYSTAPNEKRSLRVSSSFPRTCSGDIISNRTKRSAGTGQMTFVKHFHRNAERYRRGCDALCERDFGQPEIQNLGVPAVRNENVRRFNVAVYDALAMCGI